MRKEKIHPCKPMSHSRSPDYFFCSGRFIPSADHIWRQCERHSIASGSRFSGGPF
jgi:hypothetical protein